MARVTAGATGASALTFTPDYVPNMTGTTPALVSSGTGFAAYTTQPVKGALIHNLPLNANGQRYFWRARHINDVILVLRQITPRASVTLMPVSVVGRRWPHPPDRDLKAGSVACSSSALSVRAPRLITLSVNFS